MNNFAVLDITKLHLTNAIILRTTTNNPCHLTCYYTDKTPLRHKTSRRERGIDLPWGTYFCFVAWKSIEQTEPGDTLIHTFVIPEWSFCQTNWFTFRGTVASVLSPSVSAIFEHHHPGIHTHTEEQLQYNSIISIADFLRAWAGQRLTISNRFVTKLAFVLNKFGSPTGDVTFQIRRVSDDTLIVSKFWGNAAALQTEGSEQWEEVEFNTPIFINEEVRIIVWYPDSVSNFRVRQHYQNTNVKPSENQTFRSNDTWTDSPTADCAYRYTYFH